MAIYAKLNQAAFGSTHTTIICAGTKIEGSIQTESRLQVDGELYGPISSNNMVSIGKTGIVKGDIIAEKLIIAGRFSGTADSEEIRIISGGNVAGKLTCKDLSIEKGGVLNGQNTHRRSHPELENRSFKKRSIVAVKVA